MFFFYFLTKFVPLKPSPDLFSFHVSPELIVYNNFLGNIDLGTTFMRIIWNEW